MKKFSDKVIYQIYPKSFYDSDGDGLGDLRGVTAKLDYLRDLGVDTLWLTPFFPSPQRDNGYDVADYTAIDPQFGTMADLEELIAQADKRGIGLMLDMVFNHTSTAHDWFQRALAGDKTYQDYYIFRDGTPDVLPTNWVSKFGGPAWEYLPELGKWYLHLFDVTQADLNWENPAVREELKKVLRFWKSKGVKGFRFDVVNLISKPAVFEDDHEGDGRRFYTDGRHVHEFLKELVRDTGLEENVTVGEMSSTSLDNCVRYTAPEEHELSMCFSFHHLKVDYKNGDKWALMPPDRQALKDLLAVWQEEMQAHNGWNALFWCNHDQ
ncbi:MAG: alpha-amylase family glycosyl hydrolase, partial [Gemmiger sp.]